MRDIRELKNELGSGGFGERLGRLYALPPEDAGEQAMRYIQALEGLESLFGPKREAALFSAPGRVELGGNHTDHQHGHVLAAAVTLDMIAAVSPNGLDAIRLHSLDYGLYTVELDDLEPRAQERGTTGALIRGCCAELCKLGARPCGLDIYVSSNVPRGSGISSSAAFEILICTILNRLWLSGDQRLSPVRLAQIGRVAEYLYFGKPCGLMDQMACSLGGAVGMDFSDPSAPRVERLELDLEGAGLGLVLIASGGDHSDLTGEYAAVTEECCAVARLCGGQVLGEVGYGSFMDRLPLLRRELGDRAVLRALHFYNEDRRAQQELEALKNKDMAAFLRLVEASGHSSWEYLQNVICAGAVKDQSLAFTIALAKELLQGRGAVRVHGGGFAGTALALVPLDMADRFIQGMEALLGEGCCLRMSLRPEGGMEL